MSAVTACAWLQEHGLDTSWFGRMLPLHNSYWSMIPTLWEKSAYRPTWKIDYSLLYCVLTPLKEMHLFSAILKIINWQSYQKVYSQLMLSSKNCKSGQMIICILGVPQSAMSIVSIQTVHVDELYTTGHGHYSSGHTTCTSHCCRYEAIVYNLTTLIYAGISVTMAWQLYQRVSLTTLQSLITCKLYQTGCM